METAIIRIKLAILMTVLAFTSGHASYARGQAAINRPAGLKDFEEQQKIALDLELERLKSDIQLPEDSFQQIRDAVEEPLKSGAAKLFKHNKNYLNAFDKQLGTLSRELGNAVHSAAAKHVDAKLLADYLDDYRKFNDWEDQASRLNVMVFLDNYLELSDDQFIVIDKLLTENWDYGWNFEVTKMSFDGYKACKPVLEALKNDKANSAKIEELLTDVQREIFGQLDVVGEGYNRIFRRDKNKVDQQFLDESNLFLKRAIESLNSQSRLSPSQVTILKIGMKGSVKRVAQLRNTQKQEYDEKGTLWRMSACMDSSFHQIRNDKIWKQTIKKALSGPELVEYHRTESKRSRRRAEVSSVFGLSYLGQARRLSYKEIVSFHELATNSIVAQGETTLYRGTYVLHSITDEELKSVLGTATSKAIEARLEKFRQVWENKEKDKKKE